MNKTKIVISETKKRLIDDIQYLLKEVDNDIVSKHKDIDNSALIASILKTAPEKSILDLVVTKEYLKDFLKSVNASVIISEDTDLENEISDTPEEMNNEVNEKEDNEILSDFETVKTKAQELITRIENSEDEVPDIADTSKLVSISVAIQEKIDELNNLDVSDNSFDQKFEELKQFITSKESEVIDILGGDNATDLNEIISDDDETVTSDVKIEPGKEDAVTSDVKVEPGDEDPVTSKSKPKCEENDIILGIGMGEDELDDDLTDEDLENPDLVSDEEPMDEEGPLDDVEEPVTSEMTPEMDDVESVTSETVETEDTTVAHENNVEIPLDTEKAKNVHELITDMENELSQYTASDDGSDPTKSQTIGELFNKLNLLKTMVNYEPTPEDVVEDIDDNLKSLGNLIKDNSLNELKDDFNELKDNLLTSLDSIADPSDVTENIEDETETCDNETCNETDVNIEEDADYPEYDVSNFNSDDIEETDLEDGDVDHFNVNVTIPEKTEDKTIDVDVTPYDASNDDFSVKETEVVDPILDIEDNTEEFNVEETLAPKKKYKPKFKKTK